MQLCMNSAKTEIEEIANVLSITNREDVSVWKNIATMEY